MRRVVNPVVRRLLASPVHDLVGESTVLVRFRGRRTGRELSTPANAVVDGDSLTLTSLRRRAWWRNLRGGAPVVVTLAGRQRAGRGEVPDVGREEIAALLSSLYATAGHPIDAERALALAEGRVLIRIELESAADPPPPLRGRALWSRWTKTVTIGETLAFSIPAVAGALIAAADLGPLASAPIILAAGLGEGLVLGFSQALVVRRTLPAISSRSWIAATALGALIAWAVSLVPTSIGEGLEDLAPGVLAAGGLVLGVVFLLSIGGLQWRVLREHVSRAGWWVAAVAAGWVAALTAFMAIASPLWQEGQALGLIIAIGVAAGLVMALVMAAITGYALMRLSGAATSSSASPSSSS
ncbi:MAG: hypothetical protein WBC01_07030 [Solirubrobacterales bacterium]